MTFKEQLIYGLTRIRGVRSLFYRDSVERRVFFGLWNRPAYAYGVYHAADQARRLGVPAIAVAEVGVAGGRGLLALESIARTVSRALDINIDVYGFDLGSGLPAVADYRDAPHVWRSGFYKMDEQALRARLTDAHLVLGDVSSTTREFVSRSGFAPLGFVAFDLDYYSSTRGAFQLLSGPQHTRLPRVYCYFDNLMWPDLACHNEFIGELAAINDYNLHSEHRKICPIYGLAHRVPVSPEWTALIRVHHDFLHPSYTTYIAGDSASQTALALESE